MLIILLLLKKLRPILKFRSLNDKVRIYKYKNIFIKVCTKNWSREIFSIDSFLKTNPWTYKLKLLWEAFMKKNCCWVYYKSVIIQNQTVILEIRSKNY